MGDKTSFFSPKSVTWSISLIPIIVLFVSIAVGSHFHHFSANELPTFYRLILLKPEAIIFLVMLIIIAILILIFSFIVFFYFGNVRRVFQKSWFNQTMRFILLIIGLTIPAIMMIFSFIRLDSIINLRITDLVSENFTVLMVNLFICLVFSYFFICDIIFLSIYGSQYSRLAAIYDTIFTMIFVLIFCSRRFIIDKLVTQFKYQFILYQITSIFEFLFFFLLFFRYHVLSWQMYGKRKLVINKKHKKYI